MDTNENSGRVPIGVWIFHLVWSVAAVIGIAAYLLNGNTDRYAYIQTIVLTLTLLALVIYTAYTRQMHKAMVHQTTVGILPVMEVQIVMKGDAIAGSDIPGALHAQSALSLKNIGNGTALNVKIESLFVYTHRYPTEWLPMKFHRLYSLAVGEKVWIKDIQPDDVATLRVVGGGLGRPDLFKSLLGPQFREDPDLKIRFSDVLGNKYVQVIHLGQAGVRTDTVQLDDGRIKRTRIMYNKEDWS